MRLSHSTTSCNELVPQEITLLKIVPWRIILWKTVLQKLI